MLDGTFVKGDFLFDAQGRPIANDFVNVVAAGRLALDGEPAAAYDWPAHKQAEVRVIGHDFADYYGWHYLPPFLFVAAALATLPFVAAAIDPGRPCRGTLIVLLLVAQRACCVATKSAAH